MHTHRKPASSKQSQISKHVVEAIGQLREPNGSTFKDIKRYITKKYGYKIQEKLLSALRRGSSFGLIESQRPGFYKLDSSFVFAAKNGKMKNVKLVPEITTARRRIRRSNTTKRRNRNRKRSTRRRSKIRSNRNRYRRNKKRPRKMEKTSIVM